MADSDRTAELEELRRRLALLEEGTGHPRKRHRIRSLCAVLLILLACVLTPLSAVAAWTSSQVTDTDQYLATVTPLAEDPGVRAAVTDRVTTEIMKHLPVGTLLDEVAPEQRPLLDAALGRVSSAITALGLAAGAAVLGLALAAARTLYLDRLPAGVNQDAATAVFDALVHYLRSTVRAVLVLGVLVAFGAWVSGGGRWAGTVRGFWEAGFGAVRVAAGKAGLRLGPVGRFVHRFKAWLLGALAVLELLDDRPDATV
ncbi:MULTISPECIES: hypothetical protein [unclassified Kitasatospora]|uniref:hypothetical protein n=1 Tax=unclassified Kitasatospora TaxID=2633591 RepID=UPI00070DD184|nr:MULTISPECIES: hypothetical protein [unclassified Kitasatospora]KQV18787.1 hypothetical protein ASC99_06245 [Kitasatospora sp. Root107]KRB74769.1 hypothetical protein ASE03_20180 [Kitasatospora sp. Root187]